MKLKIEKIIYTFLRANWFYACGVCFSSFLLKDQKAIDVIGCVLAVTFLISTLKKHIKTMEEERK